MQAGKLATPSSPLTTSSRTTPAVAGAAPAAAAAPAMVGAGAPVMVIGQGASEREGVHTAAGAVGAAVADYPQDPPFSSYTPTIILHSPLCPIPTSPFIILNYFVIH
jgi:hypothetical protein